MRTRTRNGIVFNLGEFALTACQPHSRAMKEPRIWRFHPFGQIPTYEEGDLALFETGAIVFYIAERHAGLLLDDANARARAITWMFAALNKVEPPVLEVGTAKILEGGKPWTKERLPLVEDRVRGRLDQLSGRLGDADWLDGALMMVSVLLRLRLSGLWTSIRTWLLSRPRRSTPRLQAGFRRSIGG